MGPDLGYVIIVALGAVVVHSYVTMALQVTGTTRAHRLARRRARQAELAAFEASDDEPAFAPEHLEKEIRLMLDLVERAWATGQDTLADRHDRDELTRWARSMEDIYGHPTLRGLQEVRLVHVVNREGDTEDRVDVWIRVRMAPASGWTVDRWALDRSLDQHWTLGRRGDSWELLRFTDDPLSSRTLKRRLIPMPWTDHDRLRGESLREMAAGEPAAIGVSDPYRDAAVRARDLALVDARYSDPVIESVLVRLLDAWEQAALGRPQALRRLASQRAGDALRRKLAVEGIELFGWRVMRLEDRRDPVRMSIDLDLSGGNELRWVLESCDGSDPLWRLIATSDPLRQARG